MHAKASKRTSQDTEADLTKKTAQLATGIVAFTLLLLLCSGTNSDSLRAAAKSVLEGAAYGVQYASQVRPVVTSCCYARTAIAMADVLATHSITHESYLGITCVPPLRILIVTLRLGPHAGAIAPKLGR